MGEHISNDQDQPLESVSDVRDRLIRFVGADLVGPAHGIEEIIEDPPYVKYSAGVLFPQESQVDESGSVGGIEASDFERAEEAVGVEVSTPEIGEAKEGGALGEGEAEIYDDAVTMANRYKPSSIALTFIVPQSCHYLNLTMFAAEYESCTIPSGDGRRQNRAWRRKELSLEAIRIEIPENDLVQKEISGGLKFCLFVSSDSGRRVVTGSLYNATVRGSATERTFYQCGFELAGVEPGCEFEEYSSSAFTSEIDDEELVLEMMYRDHKGFAIGHGCAADWVVGENGGAKLVRTESIPTVTVPPIEPRTGEDRYLSMRFLQGYTEDPDTDIPNALYSLCTAYAEWIEQKERIAREGLSQRYRRVAVGNLEMCRVALRRIRRGVEVIENDPVVLEAFKLANRAILMQQHHSRVPIRSIDSDPVSLPQWDDYPNGLWRTFQLAFILMTIPSIVDSADTIQLNDEDVLTRDLVDLIWFPTGGGKTEAYLGLSAFLIFWTRLRDPNSTGCKVLMRYTLRLLTSQQFQRASSLICACELIRDQDPSRLGSSRISVGLWVGKSLTPNDEKAASRAITNLLRKGEEARNPFQLLSCPWCGTTLNDKRMLGYAVFQRRQIFLCQDSSGGEAACPFSLESNPLPVCVVDESIYASPPTLLIGTVDKFAMLAWREKAGEIFRVGGGPELIVQDELHLISGPLGSMVGLYESVIDFLCSRLRPPKIIASTATIRRASEQCKSLYARPMFQFPPAGLEVSDSFFAAENPDSPGRVYAGFLPSAASSGLAAQIRCVAALQQGLFLLEGEPPDDWLDPYFTLVQYFSSLKELGRAATFVRADIPEFLPTMHRSYGLTRNDDPDRRRYLHTSEELTSRKNEDEIPRILAQLEKNYHSDAKYESQALDTILATNMISVGMDVDRLGLMLIVTQPKGTSEYIQASSRVGRSTKSPGLVITLYNAGRPRDRSHYEQFRSYHDTFYRQVEPTSVTPFSPPAMERALHAVLVIAARQVARWSSPQLNRSDSSFQAFLSFLERRVQLVDPEHFEEFKNVLHRRLDEWERSSVEAWGDIVQRSDKTGLMRPAGRLVENSRAESWETPTSMRNVDVECGAIVVRYIG